jgi:hypothetical protein
MYWACWQSAFLCSVPYKDVCLVSVPLCVVVRWSTHLHIYSCNLTLT